MMEMPKSSLTVESAVGAHGFTLALTGDVMLGRIVNETIARRGFAYPWGDVIPLLHKADLVAINLECALTSRTDRWTGDPEKPFFFRADPSVVETLRLGSVDFAALANNHIVDFGTEGLLDTVAALDRAGIAHAGAGANIDLASAAAVLAVDGWRVAIVAFADYPEAWCATAISSGMCFTPVSLEPDDFDVVAQAIARARAAADTVIFSIHWGPNMRLEPPPLFRDFARRVLAAGADVFWGHSAHVLQGMEVVAGKPILYDTGDFIDDYAVDSRLRNDLSALFLVDFVPPVVDRVRIVPTVIRQMQVRQAIGDTRQLIVRRLTKLCREMGTPLVDTGDELVCWAAASTPEHATTRR
jgi:poly-gamma-glutamate capsule biosynthesis protein CapA/YwtB (metallophosphatase superfamily)